MKLLKFSMLMNYFAVSKNSKRALLIINIGIFLSIFACTAAMITLYIENKVNQFEFRHFEISQQKRMNEIFAKEIPAVTRQTRMAINIEETNNDFFEFLGLNDFGQIIISEDDKQALTLFDALYFNTDYIEIIEVFELMFLEKLLSDVDHEQLLKVLDNLKKNLTKLSTIQSKKIHYKDIIFKGSYDYLASDVLLTIEHQYKKNRDYEYYLLARENDKLLIKLLDNALYYTNIWIEKDNKTLKEINDKIKYYSNLEKHLILIAFLLQLTVFIIIQFFEVSSVNFNILKRIKR